MVKKSSYKISVVFITYNRPDMLVSAIKAFSTNCQYNNLEIIIADDCSNPDIDPFLENLPVDKLVKTEFNQGLGANSNNGIKAVTGDFVIHHQDDFVLATTEPFWEKAITIMEKHPEVGLVRLHHLTKFPNKTDYQLPDGTNYSILDFEQPKDMKNRIYLYSDHPHIKRADFHEKTGYFAEGLGVGETEDEFCIRFNSNKRYKIATLWRSDIFKNMGLSKSTRKPNKRTIIKTHLEKSAIGSKTLELYTKLPITIRKKIR